MWARPWLVHVDNNACDDQVSIESQPQNAELRNNPESFHPCGLDRGLFTWTTMFEMTRPRARRSFSWGDKKRTKMCYDTW